MRSTVQYSTYTLQRRTGETCAQRCSTVRIRAHAKATDLVFDQCEYSQGVCITFDVVYKMRCCTTHAEGDQSRVRCRHLSPKAPGIPPPHTHTHTHTHIGIDQGQPTIKSTNHGTSLATMATSQKQNRNTTANGMPRCVPVQVLHHRLKPVPALKPRHILF